VAVGAAGLLSVIPPLNDAGIVFGLMQIVWLGVTMLRKAERPERLLVPEVEPA
jgi:threonine/homoserine/homoserine lactone efflux protein